uniref:Uncharacterized protein n=1 Tax=Manihot esculenta TaxID=3983 RepID=A0A2C9WGA0_MANES
MFQCVIRLQIIRVKLKLGLGILESHKEPEQGRIFCFFCYLLPILIRFSSLISASSRLCNMLQWLLYFSFSPH